LQKAYKYSIVYFLLFSILLLGSSLLLFADKIGLSSTAIVEYYLGNEANFIFAKSWETVLKIILPHIFAFGLYFMVVLHFLLFTRHKDTKLFLYLSYAIFFVGFLELFSPYMILAGFESFAVVKLISFILLELLLLYTFWLLLVSIAQK